MQNNVLAYLFDIQTSALAVKEFVRNHTLETYSTNDLLRSAVERKFEIMGEALSRIKKENPEYLEKIKCHRDIISFRNILIHGYDSIDNLLADTLLLLQEIAE